MRDGSSSTLPFLSDEAYSLVMALSCLCYIAVLFLQWRRGRIVRKLMRLLEQQKQQIEAQLSASPQPFADSPAGLSIAPVKGTGSAPAPQPGQ